MGEEDNPWHVHSLDNFLYYCCPECEFKSQAKIMFANHAYLNHSKSKEAVWPFCNLSKEVTLQDHPNGIDSPFVNEPCEQIPVEVSIKEEFEDPIDVDTIVDEDNKTSVTVNFGRENQLDHKVEDSPYQCYKCGDIYDTVEVVKEHLSQVHKLCRRIYYGKPRDHQCFVCKCMYKNEETLNMHVCRSVASNSAQANGENNCKICDIKFITRERLVNHNRTFHHELNFNCDECDFKTKMARSLTIHKKRIHQKVKDEVCHVCGKEFFCKYSMLLHMDVAHNNCEKKYICDKCGDSFVKLNYLNGHQREKHPVYYLCAVCDTQFPSSKKLRVHLSNDHGIKCGLANFYVCDLCKEAYNSIRELNDHLINAHKKQVKEERCDLCEHTFFAGKVTLKMHVLENHGIELTKGSNTPFISDLFDTVKNTNSDLRQLGTGEVPCPVCHKMFTSKRGMADHRKQLHEKEKHIKCDQCNYTTFQPFKLKKHIGKKHSTIKYQCDQCSFYTYNDDSIKTHKKRVHEKVSNFNCPHCAKGYFKKPQYIRHLLNVHNVVYQNSW